MSVVNIKRKRSCVLHLQSKLKRGLELLAPIKTWVDNLEIDNPRVARLICKIVPAQCPFERDIILFGYTLVRIPPMCKLNPLYEQFVGLRFRALTYLVEDCGEDISEYC